MKTSHILCAAALLSASAPQSRAAYSDEILADNPVAYYRLNEPTLSTAATDLAAAQGLNNGAQDGGIVDFGTPGLINEPGNTGATFSAASNGRIVVPGFDKLGTGYSVEYWIKVNALPTGCCAPLVGDGVGANFFLMNYLIGPAQGVTGTIRPHYSFANSPVATDSNQALALDSVYHVVTTWNSLSGLDNASIYINGVVDKTITVTQNFANEAQTLFLGRDDREGYNNASFVLDEVALYDYALSATDVTGHYNAGVVPEPSSIALLAAAAGACGITRLRRS